MGLRMSDLGGLGGALLLSHQISTDRLLDSYARARDANALSFNDAAWRNHYNDLVNRYNGLLADTNRLCRSHDAQIEAMDGSLDALRGSVKILEAGQARVTAERDRAQLRYEILLALHKERDPGFKFFEE